MASAKYRLSASLHWHRSAGGEPEESGTGPAAPKLLWAETDRRFLMKHSESMLASSDAGKALEMKGNKEDPQSAGPVPPPVLRGC